MSDPTPHHQKKPKLLIIGASVRAAALSAHRAGYEIVASDLFADRDLREIATCIPITEYPAEFGSVREQFPDLPLIYTGAMENHPQLIESFAKDSPVFGNDADTLRQVRNPFELARVFESEGTRFPITTATPPSPADNQNWLVKPWKSAGGSHVECWSPDSPRPPVDHVFQQQLTGPACSASFVVAKTDRRVRFLGATRMLVGRNWQGPVDFSYCGSISTQPSPDTTDLWIRIGQTLCDQFCLIGVFGVDAIETNDGIVPIEVNPRYTASMEVIEPSLAMPVLGIHIAAYRDESPANDLRGDYRPYAKLIVYATKPFVVPEKLPSPGDVRLVDIPNRGLRIEPGQPILTILSPTDSDTAEQLLRKAANYIRTRIQV